MAEAPEKRRIRYARRVKEGLCLECGKPASPNSVRCAKHTLSHNILNSQYKARNRELLAKKERERRQRWREDGKCVRCGTPLIEGEIGYCMGCRAGKYEPVRIGGAA